MAKKTRIIGLLKEYKKCICNYARSEPETKEAISVKKKISQKLGLACSESICARIRDDYSLKVDLGKAIMSSLKSR
nr:MAG TPA: hypothetical protein [Caudoviricetes sp.]